MFVFGNAIRIFLNFFLNFIEVHLYRRHRNDIGISVNRGKNFFRIRLEFFLNNAFVIRTAVHIVVFLLIAVTKLISGIRINNRHIIRAHAFHRKRNQILDRRHVFLRKCRRILQLQCHACGRFALVRLPCITGILWDTEVHRCRTNIVDDFQRGLQPALQGFFFDFCLVVISLCEINVIQIRRIRLRALRVTQLSHRKNHFIILAFRYNNLVTGKLCFISLCFELSVNLHRLGLLQIAAVQGYGIFLIVPDNHRDNHCGSRGNQHKNQKALCGFPQPAPQ